MGQDGWPLHGGWWSLNGDWGPRPNESNLAALKQLKIESLTASFPPQVARLYAEVLSRLPLNWHGDRLFRFPQSQVCKDSDEKEEGNKTCAYFEAFRHQGWDSMADLWEDLSEEEIGRRIMRPMKQSPRNLTCFGWLSDAAAHWVIAHSIAHLAAHLALIPLDPRKGDPATLRERDEDDADSLAIAWGFEAELQAFLAEVERAPL